MRSHSAIAAIASLILAAVAGAAHTAAERKGRPSPVPARGGQALEPLFPDLTPLRARHLQIQRSDGVRRLRFEGDLANIGRGPLELVTNRARPCPSGQRHASQVIYRDVDRNRHFNRSIDRQSGRRSAGCFMYHPEHNHWHFDAAARYRLYKPGGKDYIAQARKVSFCMRDSRRVPSAFGEFHYRAYYGDCSLGRPEGISVGWADVYQWFLAGQSLRLPARVRSDVYCLSINVDPKQLLYESDETNNLSWRAFRIRGGATGGRTVAPYDDNSVCRPPQP